MGANWEPPWYTPGQAIRAAQLLNVANLIDIQNGLGAAVAADDLRITRNLIAHNLPNTWCQFQLVHRRNGVGARIAPEVFVISRNAGVGARFIESWIQDLENSLAAAVV